MVRTFNIYGNWWYKLTASNFIHDIEYF